MREDVEITTLQYVKAIVDTGDADTGITIAFLYK